jgi:hypothetical protein
MEIVGFWLDFQRSFPDTTPLKERLGPLLARLSRLGMEKSALLGRLMRGEEIRRRPCPKHKGMMWCSWGPIEPTNPHQYECCDGTGWLRNPHDSLAQPLPHLGPIGPSELSDGDG